MKKIISAVLLSAIGLTFPTASFAALTEIEMICLNYATTAVYQARERRELRCTGHGIEVGSNTWTESEDYHYEYCMRMAIPGSSSWDVQQITILNYDNRETALKACRAEAGAGGTVDAGVKRKVGDSDTDLYDAREGNSIDVLNAGSSVTTVGACGDEWCQLSNPQGWVWGGDLN